MKLHKHKSRTVVIKLALNEFDYHELDGMTPKGSKIQDTIRDLISKEIAKTYSTATDEEQ
jgi:hypothetical protein